MRRLSIIESKMADVVEFFARVSNAKLWKDMIKLQDIVERVFCFFWNSFHAKFQGKENVGGLWSHSPATCKISGMQQTHTITSTSAVVGFYKKFGCGVVCTTTLTSVFLLFGETEWSRIIISTPWVRMCVRAYMLVYVRTSQFFLGTAEHIFLKFYTKLKIKRKK